MILTCHRPGIKAAAALVATTLATLALVAPASPAFGASAKFTIETSPNVTVPGGSIESMSCSSASACTAVGFYTNGSGLIVTLAERWNGSSWRKQSTPNPASDTTHAVAPALLGVSCPTADFCEAVGAYGSATGPGGASLAETWNGSSWSMQPVPAPSGSTGPALRAVSCASPSFCEATGSYETSSGTLPLAEMWNGTAWSIQSVPSPSGITVELQGVSCASATFCEAMGFGLASGGGSLAFADQWNGTSWQQQPLAANAGAVSCVSADFCEAIGGTGSSGGEVWNGTTWSPQSVPAPTGESGTLEAVSCASATFCEIVGNASNGTGTASSLAETWNGTSWSVQSPPSVAGAFFTGLNGVSCTSATACEAAGGFQPTSQAPFLTALAEAWNGSSWRIQHAVTPGSAVANSFNAVSCVSTSFCEAVGNATDATGNGRSLAEEWNGTAWKVQPLDEPGNLRGVSCVSATFCEAVGNTATAGGAWQWNGTSWTAQTISGSVFLSAVSCTSATFCEAVSGNGAAAAWNGTSWSVQATASGFTSLSSVSCTSADFCEAVGFNSSGDNAETWDGSSWSAQPTPTPSGGSSLALNAVSCAAAAFCETVGWFFDSSFNQDTVAEEWDGTSWTLQSTPNPVTSTVNSLLGVWCTSSTSCASVGEAQNSSFVNITLAQVWNGTSWSLRSTSNRSFAGNNVLNGVWCAVNGPCTAVGATTDRGQTSATLAETGA